MAPVTASVAAGNQTAEAALVIACRRPWADVPTPALQELEGALAGRADSAFGEDSFFHGEWLRDLTEAKRRRAVGSSLPRVRSAQNS